LGESCFSGPVLVLLAPIAAAAVGALGILYRDGLKSRNEQIADLSERLDLAHERLQTGIPVMDEAKAALRGKSGGRQRS
jgi:hypothetical protein